MKFSILIPTLNEEKYIGGLLGSLMKQTFKDFEVIIIDAHSEDKTVAVASKYKTKLDLRVINSTKRNISYQRNLAAKKARSDHFIFFDADVIVENNFIANINHAQVTKDFQLATSWLKPLSDRLSDKITFGLFNRFYLEITKYFTPGGIGAFLYIHRLAFEKVKGFDLTTNYGEDFDIVKRIHHEGFKYHLFRRPAVGFSVRRLDKEGRPSFIYKMIKSGIYYHTHGNLKNKNLYIKHEFGKF